MNGVGEKHLQNQIKMSGTVGPKLWMRDSRIGVLVRLLASLMTFNFKEVPHFSLSFDEISSPFGNAVAP